MKVFLAILALVAICSAKPQVNNPATDFVNGFLVGVHETKQIEDLLKCMSDMDPILKKIEAAINHLVKFNFQELMEGLKLLKEAMFDFVNMLTPCLQGFEQLQKLFEAMKNWDFSTIINKILKNAVLFLADIMECWNAFKSHDHYAVGKGIGDILYNIFLDEATVGDVPLVDFLTGFLTAIHETRKVNDLLKCMDNTSLILEKIMTSLKLILKLKFEEMMKGFSMLFEAFLDLEAMLKPCLEGYVQFQKLMKAISDSDILYVIIRIIKDPNPYIMDINEVVNAIATGNFKDAGEGLGDIMYRLFLVESVDELQTMAIEFMKGFLEGINEKGDINNMLECVKKLEFIIPKIVEAIQDIIKGDITSIIKGITLLLEGVRDMLRILTPCQNGYEQIAKLMEAIKNVKILNLVFKILDNPKNFVPLIVNCVKAFTDGDYHGAGLNLGTFLYRLLLIKAVPEMEYKDAVEFIKGFLKGINQSHNFNDVETCLDDIPVIVEDIKAAIEALKNLDWKNIEKIVHAFLTLFDTGRKIIEAILPCSKAPKEMEIILKKIKNIDPNKLINKITAHLLELVQDIIDALTKAGKHDYFGCGDDLGDVFYRLVLVE